MLFTTRRKKRVIYNINYSTCDESLYMEQNHVTPYCRTTTKRVSRRCLLHTRERSEILRSYYATRIEYSHLIDLIAKLGSDYLVEQIDIETASKYMYDKINVVQKASNYIIIYSQINCEDIA